MVRVSTQVVSGLHQRSQSGWFKALERLCDVAVLCDLVRYPTVVAATTAYEVQRDDAMKGYEAIAASVILLMATVLVSRVGDNVQRRWKTIRDSVRRRSEMLSYMLWVTVALLAIPMILTSAFNDVNILEAPDSIIQET